MPPLTLFDIGSQVVIGEDILATITGINIRSEGSIQYECAWFNGRSRSCEWLQACEVKATDATERGR